jgi:hypothetical protein
MPLDEGEVRRAFEATNAILAGLPSGVVLAALQDLTAAVCCVMSDTKSEALKLASDVSGDIKRTVERNYDHYSDPANQGYSNISRLNS